MRRAAAGALVVVVAGCGSPDSFVVATVTAPAGLPPVGRLRVTVSNGGSGTMLDYPRDSTGQPVAFPATVGIRFSRSRDGTVDLVVDALEPTGAQILASGSVRTSIVVGGARTVDVALKAGASPCGNGMIDAGEECDDRNRVSGDGCDFRCSSERGTDGGAPEPPNELVPDGSDADDDGSIEPSVEAADVPEPGLDPGAEPNEPIIDAPIDLPIDAPLDVPVETGDVPIDAPAELPIDAPAPEPGPPDAPDALPDGTVDAPASDGPPAACSFYAESEATSITDVTTFADAVTLGFSPTMPGSHLIVTTALYSSTNVMAGFARFTEVQAVVDSIVYAQARQFPIAAGNQIPFAAHQVVDLAAGPHTVAIQYRTTNAAATASIGSARILAISLADVFNQAQAPQVRVNNTNAAYTSSAADIVELSFSPPTAEKYLVLASAEVTQADVASAAFARLALGPPGSETDQGEMRYTPPMASDPGNMWRSYATMRVLDLASGPQTLRLQLRTGGTFAASMKNGRVTAIPLSALAPLSGPPVGYGESDAMPMSGLTTFETDATASLDLPLGSAYVVMGGGFLRNEAPGPTTGADAIGRVAVDGAGIGEMSFRPAASPDYVPFFDMKRLDLGTGSHSLTVDYKTSVAGSSKETFIKASRVVTLPVGSCM